jgi:hypothetical protein
MCPCASYSIAHWYSGFVETIRIVLPDFPYYATFSEVIRKAVDILYTLYKHAYISEIFFCSYEAYGERYCAGERSAYTGEFTGSSNMQELQVLLKIHCMIRRLKTDVLKQIPSKIRS